MNKMFKQPQSWRTKTPGDAPLLETLLMIDVSLVRNGEDMGCLAIDFEQKYICKSALSCLDISQECEHKWS